MSDWRRIERQLVEILRSEGFEIDNADGNPIARDYEQGGTWFSITTLAQSLALRLEEGK